MNNTSLADYSNRQLRELFRYWTNTDLRLAMQSTDDPNYYAGIRRTLVELRDADPKSLPEFSADYINYNF